MQELNTKNNRSRRNNLVKQIKYNMQEKNLPQSDGKKTERSWIKLT